MTAWRTLENVGTSPCDSLAASFRVRAKRVGRDRRTSGNLPLRRLGRAQGMIEINGSGLLRAVDHKVQEGKTLTAKNRLRAESRVYCDECGRETWAFASTCLTSYTHTDMCQIDHKHVIRCMLCDAARDYPEVFDDSRLARSWPMTVPRALKTSR